MVRKQIAEAQRGGKHSQYISKSPARPAARADLTSLATEGSHRVVAVGMTSVAQYSSGIQTAANQHGQPVFRTVPAPPSTLLVTSEAAASLISARHPSHAASGRYATSASSAPVLNLPAITNPFATLPIPKLNPSPENPGYNEAHRFYDEMRQYYASKAYTSAATAELVIVKVRMVTLEPGKKNPTFISVGVALFFFCSLILTIGTGISESI